MINDVFSNVAYSESIKLLDKLIRNMLHEVNPNLYTSFHEDIAKYVALTYKSEENSNESILSTKFISKSFKI